jgi:putative Ca2+/H+ antiporter (TMEM165/GDT1 family)
LAATALGAAGGQLVGQLVPAHVLRWIAAGAFVVMGALVAWEAARRGDESAGDECAPDDDGQEKNGSTARQSWQAFAATFGLLFVAELGDKTQLAVLSLAGTSTSPWLVFVGGGAALIAVTALAVIGGEGLCRIVPRRVLLWVSATAFVVMGVLMAVGTL